MGSLLFDVFKGNSLNKQRNRKQPTGGLGLITDTGSLDKWTPSSIRLASGGPQLCSEQSASADRAVPKTLLIDVSWQKCTNIGCRDLYLGVSQTSGPLNDWFSSRPFKYQSKGGPSIESPPHGPGSRTSGNLPKLLGGIFLLCGPAPVASRKKRSKRHALFVGCSKMTQLRILSTPLMLVSTV